MSTLSPMFDKTKLITLDDHLKVERKTRKDKKKTIKVPVTEQEKLHIARLSLLNGHKGEFHSYLAEVFSEATKRPYVFYSKAVPYKNNRNYISTKVPTDVYEKILKLKVEWGYRSKLQAAHRILFNELEVNYERD